MGELGLRGCELGKVKKKKEVKRLMMHVLYTFGC